jgi:hypothetical protein
MNSTSLNSPKKFMLSAIIMAIVITTTALCFSLNKANARSAGQPHDIPRALTEWVYVDNGKVYYFDSDGLLCYKLLKDARERYNY